MPALLTAELVGLVITRQGAADTEVTEGASAGVEWCEEARVDLEHEGRKGREELGRCYLSFEKSATLRTFLGKVLRRTRRGEGSCFFRQDLRDF